MDEPKLENVREGEKFKGHIVKKKYYFDNYKNYIIFENEKGKVIYFSSVQISDISALIGECNYLRDIVHSEKTKSWINAQIAAALNEYFCDNCDKCREILGECVRIAKNKETARKRLYYIGTFFVSIIILLLCLAILYKLGISCKYLNIAIFGAFGGFISLNSKLEKISFSIEEETINFIFVALYKLLFSIISAIIVYYLIEADVVLTALKKHVGVIYIAAALGGFSESLLSDFFAGLENDILSSKEKV